MSNAANQPFAGPLDLSGPAVDCDSRVLEDNDAPAADETVWIKNLQEQELAVSRSQAEFFGELKRRAKDAT